MIRLAWLASLALGLSLLPGALAAQDAIPPAVQKEQDYADRLLSAIERIEPAIHRLIAEDDKLAAEESRQRDKEDLDAQKQMALWAFLMVVVSALSAILTGMGIFLIARTLYYTRDAAIHAGRAVDEAKNATQAAQDAVIVTRNIGEAQTRAYLYCRSATYERRSDYFLIRVEIANAGQSPGTKVRMSGSAMIVVVGGTPQMSRVHELIESKEKTADCGPIVTRGSTFEEIYFWDYDYLNDEPTAKEKEVVKFSFDKGNELQIYLKLIWADVFETEHQVSVILHAITNIHPASSRKRRLSKGPMEVRSTDATEDDAETHYSEEQYAET